MSEAGSSDVTVGHTQSSGKSVFLLCVRSMKCIANDTAHCCPTSNAYIMCCTLVV